MSERTAERPSDRRRRGVRGIRRTARIVGSVLLAASLAVPLTAVAEDPSAIPDEGPLAWRLEREDDGISVYTRRVEDSPHRAVKATMRLTTPIAPLVALVKDTDACAEWAAFCKRAFVAEAASETEAWIYTHNDMPWPVTDRDAVSHVRWYHDAGSGAVWMDSVAAPEHLPREKGRVRLEAAVTSWRFTPVGEGVVEITTQAHVDPAGPVPAWITNRLLVDAPIETLRAMRDLLATGRYADASFAFLEADSSR